MASRNADVARMSWRRLAFPCEFGTWLLLAVALTAVVPLWLVPYPPLQDVPQHLAAMRVLRSYADPAYGFSTHFVLQLLHTQYLAYYLACDALSYLFELRVANLIVVSAAIVSLPLAGGALLQALGRDRALGLLLIPLTYNAHLILGFLNFVAALPLCLYGLALSARQRQHFSAFRAAALSALMLLCFYTHVVPFALLMLGHGLLHLSRDLRALGRALVTTTPVLPSLLFWLVRSPAGAATAEAAGATGGRHQATFRPVDRALSELPAWLLDVFDGDAGRAVMQAWAGLMLLLVAVSLLQCVRAGAPPDPLGGLRLRLLPLPLVCMAGYLWLPSGYDWIWPIAQRFALLACVLILPALPRLSASFRAPVLALGVALSAYHVSQAQAAFTGFSAEVGDFDGALATIPPRSKVAGLMFERASKFVRFSPYLHYVAHYQAQKGGVVMFTFADFPQSPFAFRPEARPPRVPPRWEWMPGRVRPARDLAYYDYVLLRGGPGPIARDSQNFERIFHSTKWSVYRRRQLAAGTVD